MTKATPAAPSFTPPPWTVALDSGASDGTGPGESADTVIEGLEDDPFDARLMATSADAEAAPHPVAVFVRRAGEQAEALADDVMGRAEIALDHMARHRAVRPVYVVGALAGARAMLMAMMVPMLAALALTAALAGADATPTGERFRKVLPVIAHEAPDEASAMPEPDATAEPAGASEPAGPSEPPATTLAPTTLAPTTLAPTTPAANESPAGADAARVSDEPVMSARERRRAAARQRRIQRRRAARRRAQRARRAQRSRRRPSRLPRLIR